ncbi:spermidine/putrescine ABC transporter permease [Lampropedia cohaerens]|uniref:Spermidine/putrescine ABC transporter permease n=1 Tax=Lampropedia cohaerens TaxID=1610491 RepID=A0A0U1Q2Y7_9BURK|nr:ABC transporter permease subunit [Lampropedia cohaerens]KKW69111.1 spermidine/putrescine ABC transporter permease [Lampropedia cohaerens]
MQTGKREKMLGRLWLLLVFVFLYLPIVALVVFSFTDSPVPNVWAGFSLRWYARLWEDEQLLQGLWRSLQLAACSATAATVLGTLAGVTLHHMRRHIGRSIYSALLRAPLVMPEVLVGLSLLLLLVSLQRAFGYPERGLLTIWIGHALIGLAYATVVIVARLRDLNPQLEEAAQDLGARPAQVFFLVILPNIGQALLAAWLLTFTVSLDDVVIASFLSGPGSTTMPMAIFSRARLGLDPTVNAMATVVIVVVAVAVGAASYLMAVRQRRHQAELSASSRT